MDIFSHQITPPLPSPLPTESTLPPVLLPPSMSQLHIPSESPAPVLLPPSTSQPSNYKYYSPCDIELLLDLDLPHTSGVTEGGPRGAWAPPSKIY